MDRGRGRRGGTALLLQKATNQLTRRTNERLVLRTIYERSPLSRADVSRLTGLTRTTVSGVVDDLIELGLTEEAGFGPSTGGKAPIMLRVPTDARHTVGVHVDDERISGAVVNLHGEIRQRASAPLRSRDGETAIAGLEALVDRLVGAAERPLLGIGVGAPGLIDTASGVVRWAVNLDWRELPLGERLARRTGLPIRVVNDSQAAAMAEWTFGHHEGASAMIVLKVGWGIGAGIILGGRLYQGDDSGAGEVGHIRVRDDGPSCRCGNRGCLETVAGVRGLLARATDLLASGVRSSLGEGELTLEAVAGAYREEDGLAAQVVMETAMALGRTLGTITGTLDIRDIVVIGPMSALGEGWLAAVRREARRSALPLLAERSTIRFGRLGPDVVELGAAALLMTSELGLVPAA
jgi:predicted NBD/HSP70 family sugar kinase